jgi:MFS transporter, AAHS family, 4-hydroxybenzoate transporter
MINAAPVNVAEVIDHAELGRFQIGVIVLCAVCLLLDGFDTQAVSYTGPSITREWHIASALLGQVFGATNFGVLVGALTLPMLADKIGRRPILIAGTIFFGVVTFFTGFAASLEQLIVFRFIGGVGLGCIIPNATALVGEYTPLRIRVPVVIAFGCGMNAGGALGGLVAALLIPGFGWRSVFYVGGAIPLLLAIAMLFLLPESLQFLVLRGKNPGKWLRRINSALPMDAATRYVIPERSRRGVPILHLFHDGRFSGTLLLWVVNFMNLLNIYLLTNWMPTITRDAGLPARLGLLLGALFQVGGTVGTLGLAWMAGRFRFLTVLTCSFAVASVSIALIGQPGLSLVLLFTVVFISGWCISGSQPAVNTVAATYYPTYLRSTGIGAGLGVGRVGAIVGPVLGGFAVGHQWSGHEIYLAAAVPAAISAVAMFALQTLMRRPSNLPA